MGVTYLLDTHCLLWFAAEPSRISCDVLGQLIDPANTVVVSAVSAFEIATTSRLGKLPWGEALTKAWPLRLAEMGIGELPLTAAHGIYAGELAWNHRDPFDRLLLAQAVLENMTLVSTDSAFRDVVGVRVLSW